MQTFLLVLLIALFTFTADAAPRRRSNGRTYQSAPTTTYTTSSHMATGHNGTAQGVAEMMASRGTVGHFGGNTGYEGVGSGSTPEQALSSCCYSNSGMAVVDQGVACGRNGRWYACKRYR